MTDATERPEAAVPKLEPGAVFAGYRIECVLDRGGMGVVYKAVDVDLDRTVALKIIAPEHTQNATAVARFKTEARLAASLEHPNIVPIHRGGEDGGVLYLAMRFVPGTNLRQIIDRGPMELGRIAHILDQIADALDAAHARGLVHRDVKPANILVTCDGDVEHVYLTDFGLTKRLGSAGDLTRTGGWVGTPDYVAPEQIQGHTVDRRADVYSLGCVLFEMLTGHVAYPKDSDMAKLWAHVTDPPPLPGTERPDLVSAFDDVVATATAKEPADRYATAGGLAAAVRAAVTEQDAKHAQDAAQDTSDGNGAVADLPFAGLTAAESAGAARSPRAQDTPAEPEPATPAPAATPRPATPVPAVAAPSGAGMPAASQGAPAPGTDIAVAPGGTGHNGEGPAAPGRSAGGRRRRSLGAAVGLVAAGGAVAAVLLLGSSNDSSKGGTTPIKEPPGQKLTGDLAPVPTNHVNAVGTAKVYLDGTLARVQITTNGLLDGNPHALHIHAGALGQCPPGSAARLHNGHLAIATHDAVHWYGPPVTALTLRGDTTPEKSLLAFRRYPRAGNIRYSRAVRVSDVVAAYIRTGNAVVIAHGVDYNRNLLYDGTLDRSDINRSLPGEATAPALCGPLVAAPKPAAGSGKTATAQGPQTFTASMSVEGGTPAPGAPGWLCPLGHTPSEVDRARA